MQSVLFAELPEGLLKALKKSKIIPTSYVLVVVADEQVMQFYHLESLVKSYKISTAKNGLGSQEGSFKTPLGLHRISNKYGTHAALYSIFESREFTGFIWDPVLKKYENEDLILTRILRLKGLEKGVNLGKSKGKVIDSFNRYIYIHGTNQESLIGTPASHGCIRMFNKDIVELYSKVPEDSLVWITKSLN